LAFCFSVVKGASLIKLQLFVEPLDDKVFFEDFLVVEYLHKCSSVLEELWATSYEQLNNCLQEVFDSYLSVFANEAEEYGLIGGPMLDNVAFACEDAADE
jgi:hypothetical protein